MKSCSLFLFLSLIPMYCLLLSVEIHAVFGHCLSDQQSLMVQLKNAIKLDNNSNWDENAIKLDNNSNWDENSDCCVWKGVTCHKGLVTGLNLRGKSTWLLSNLSAVFDLKFLESLDLSYTGCFFTPIPSRIGELTNLRYLNLSEAGFVGQVPKEISLLTRLVSLDLSGKSYFPNLELVNPNLSFLTQNLTQLEELYLDGVSVSLTGNDLSKALSSSLPYLRELSMSGCSIAGSIDRSLLKLKSLSVIYLDFNNFDSPFPRFISKFSRLRSLSFKSCGFSGIFPKEIFQVPTLHALDVSQNELLESSLPDFLQNNSFESIVISDTKFSGRLPISIGNLRNLSRLELANCEFNGTLPNSMAELTQLVYVDLSSNKFTGSIPSFSTSKNLTKINLSHNDLNGTTTSAHWEGLLYLNDVDLSYNSLNGSIPLSLFALPSLQNIQLSCNKFNGLVPQFRNAPSMILDTLNLSRNNLEGPIPDSIFQLGKLKNLLLSFNKLNGTIQGHRFRRLEELVHLDLSHNNLSFNISGNDSLVPYVPKLETIRLASCNLRAFPDLKSHSSLGFLDLSCNQISGVIPNWTWELGNGTLNYLNLSFNQLVGIQEPYIFPPLLGVLDLHFNMLHGKLPIPPTPIYVDLSNNYFSSSIQADIGTNLSTAVFLSLSNNSLTGFIPEAICHGGGLEVLDLSNNGLSGRVPECIPQMSQKLYILNLQKNNLSGPIADAFPVNCSLKTLHLNENSIQGQVPESLSNCTKLQILDLGNNQIIDGFPSFLMNISTLRVLVLRSNRFHGLIKCLNTSSSNTWTTLQLFDAAHNDFSGELSSCLSRRIRKTRTYQDDETQSQLQNELIFEYTGALAYLMSLFEDDLLFYQDRITATFKGLDMELKNMLDSFITIDLSSNHLSGPIPEDLGHLQSFYALNLSHNGFTGRIPSSLGNLQDLESLDLSNNHLNGTIPTSFANLHFLSFLNLSFNELVGKIPTSTQLQSFPKNSFIGNKGLYGPPLIENYRGRVVPVPLPESHSTSDGAHIEWNIISAEAGFITGFGIVVAPLMFCKRWRRWYFQSAEDIGYRVIPVCLLRKWLSWKKA